MGGQKVFNPAAYVPGGMGAAAAAADERARGRLEDFTTGAGAPAASPMGLGALAAQGGGGFDPMAYEPPTMAAPLQDAATARMANAGGMGSAAMGSVGMAVPSEMPAEPRPLSAMERAAGEQQGTLDALQQYLLDNPVVHGSKANALRPIAEQAAQDFHGGGPLAVDPFQYQASATAIPRNEGETDEQYAARVAEFEAADIQGQLESYQRGIGEQVANAQTLGDVRDIGKSGHLGMKEAKVQAAEGVGAASLEQQERVAQVQSQAAQMQMQATDAARQADLERRQFANVQRDAIATIQKTQEAARAKVAALPELDPNRSFKSMSGGAKFWAVLGSLAGGAIGSTDVNDRLFAIAQNDLEAQKANAAQTFDAAAAADSAVGQQMGLYRELLAAAGDEAAADAMFLQAQLGDAAQLIEAELAQTTVPVMKAQLQSSLVDLRERINHEQMKIDTMLATTPERIATSFDPIGGRQRRLIEGQIKDERNFQQDLTKMGIEVEGKALDREAEAASKRADAEIKAARGEGGYQREAWDYAQKAAPYVAVNSSLATINKRFQDKDAPGRGLSAYFWSEEGRALREDIKETMRRQLRSETGAVIGDDELEDRFDSAYSGLGDAELFSNLERLRNANARYMQSLKAGISDDAVKFYDGNLSRRGGIHESVQAVGGTPEEDAARLGGTVVQ